MGSFPGGDRGFPGFFCRKASPGMVPADWAGVFYTFSLSPNHYVSQKCLKPIKNNSNCVY